MIARNIKYYTFDDWMSWDEDVRSEIIDGELYMMAAPSIDHQRISMEMSRQLANYLRGKPCQCFPVPVGARLNKTKDTVFEPDIVVICDKSKISGKIITGAPDMIIEILSPSSAYVDRHIKYNKYKESGVREYWIVDPESKIVEAHVLKDGCYVKSTYAAADSAPVSILEGLSINLTDVFPEEQNEDQTI